MIIPISNGQTTMPIYFPEPVVTTNSGVLQQSNTNTQSNEPILADWVGLGVFLISFIVLVICFIKSLKVIFGGEE